MHVEERPRFAAFSGWGEQLRPGGGSRRRAQRAAPSKSEIDDDIPAPAPSRWRLALGAWGSRIWVWVRERAGKLVHDTAVQVATAVVLTFLGIGGAAQYQFNVLGWARSVLEAPKDDGWKATVVPTPSRKKTG